MSSTTIVNDYMHGAKVIKTGWNGRNSPYKSIYLQAQSYREDVPLLLVPRSACITKGDILQVEGESVYVCCHNGQAQILS